ncbi:MAG TPA: hypothetical protein VHX86_05955 [Tepidisphaeraceae bacterium]|jgi:hypothetical protein|nr:hypothetical protein [Tepidisphaeraceae bacterium]
MPEILAYESPSDHDAADIRDLIAMHRLVGWLLIGLAAVCFIVLAGYVLVMHATSRQFNLHDMLYPPPRSDPTLPIDAACAGIVGLANLVSAKWIQQRRRRAFSLGVAAANLLFCVLIFPGFLAVRTLRILCRREVKAQYRETLAT